MWYRGFRDIASPTPTIRGCCMWIRLIRTIAATICARSTRIRWLAKSAIYRWSVSIPPYGFPLLKNWRWLGFQCSPSSPKHFGHWEYAIVGGRARKSKYQHDMSGRWLPSPKNHLATGGWRGNCRRKEEKRYVWWGYDVLLQMKHFDLFEIKSKLLSFLRIFTISGCSKLNLFYSYSLSGCSDSYIWDILSNSIWLWTHSLRIWKTLILYVYFAISSEPLESTF